MATHKIGKLKFNLSKEGFAFRWGDGEIQRVSFPFGRKSAEGSDAADGLGDYAGDEMGDGAYYDDDASYDDARYEDDYADDAPYDDGYDDGAYADGDEYDADGEYADDYEDGYYDEDGQYIEGPGAQSSVMQYIDENDWVTYALLVLFPPAGIYLLWRRGQFETMMRAGISVASAIWLIALIWIIAALVSSGPIDDPTTGQNIKIGTATPTIAAVTTTPTVAPSVAPTASGLGIPGLDDAPTATPIAGAPIGDAGTTGTQYVYSPPTGIYYHAIADCPNISPGTTPSRVLVETAQNRGQSPCPECFNTATFYATTNGKYYHADQYCSGMSDARSIGEQAAIAAGKKKCPVCILKTHRTIEEYERATGNRASDTPASNGALTNYMKRLSTDKSGIKVWATKGGKHFHTNSTCSGMSGASNITLLAALQAGKTACPTCASAAGRTVYATDTGKYYHKASTCSSGLKNGQPLTLAHAMAMGKDSCPTCIGNVSVPQGNRGDSSGGGDSNVSSDGTVYVYATSNGRYYHTKSDCQGMTGAEKVPLRTMLSSGRPACPVCAASANRTVYAVKGGQYYHSYATCSGMSGATAGPLAQALAYGYDKCPVCWSSGGDGGTTPEGSRESVSGVSVYRTTNGRYYHNDRTCQGMTGATKTTLETAVAEGKTACPVCASVADRTVYAVKGGKYFHYDRTCSGMTNPTSGPLAEALMHGFAACPVCVRTTGGATPAPDTGGGFTPGKSGIKVYASQNGQYYHLTRSHAGSGASYVTLETALNAGKTACPDCAKSVAERTVYAAAGDRYFHSSRDHAGSGAKAGTAASALAYGLKVCPVCKAAAEDGGTVPESSDTFKPNTSGIKVYASIGGKYFHTSKTHAGSGASHVTLETAINYGKQPCPDCASVAYRRVYATANSKYYHYSKSCAGSESSSGYLAIALAMGKDPCPVCVTGSSAPDPGTPGGPDAPSTTPSRVYIDLQGDSNSSLFHSASKCSRSGMLSGSPVTVEFVKDQDFKPCPYCW